MKVPLSRTEDRKPVEVRWKMKDENKINDHLYNPLSV
jgi:hypothetical protein